MLIRAKVPARAFLAQWAWGSPVLVLPISLLLRRSECVTLQTSAARLPYLGPSCGHNIEVTDLSLGYCLDDKFIRHLNIRHHRVKFVYILFEGV